MAIVASQTYGSVVADTITLASLASDASLVAGRAGTAVAHAGEIDSLVQVKVTTGTSPTTGKQIEIYASPSLDGTNFAGSASGTDGTLTPDAKTNMALLDIIPTDGTSDKSYTSKVFSLAAAFGGTLPPYTLIYIVHNTGVALNATAGNHWVKRQPIQFQSA